MAVNKVILLGNVGVEPKIRQTQDGTQCAQFSLATTDRAFKTANGTQVPERTEWHNVVAWRGLAGVVEKYVHKGTKVYIEGKLKTRKYNDKANIERYITEIHVDQLELLGSQSSGNTAQSSTNSQNDMQPISQNIAPQSENQSIAQSDDDELPF